MMIKQWVGLSLCTAGLALTTGAAQATVVRLVAEVPTVKLGSQFNVRIEADIDAVDEIIGFGFDLTPSAGVALRGFTAGPGFADDPVYLAPFSDGDQIRGASAGDLLLGPAVSGLNLLLGVLRLEAVSLGNWALGLGADDLAFNFTEGLIPLSPSVVNYLPTITGAAVNITSGGTPVPEPGSLACALLALGVLAGWKRHWQSSATRPRPLRHPG